MRSERSSREWPAQIRKLCLQQSSEKYKNQSRSRKNKLTSKQKFHLRRQEGEGGSPRSPNRVRSWLRKTASLETILRRAAQRKSQLASQDFESLRHLWKRLTRKSQEGIQASFPKSHNHRLSSKLILELSNSALEMHWRRQSRLSLLTYSPSKKNASIRSRKCASARREEHRLQRWALKALFHQDEGGERRKRWRHQLKWRSWAKEVV